MRSPGLGSKSATDEFNNSLRRREFAAHLRCFSRSLLDERVKRLTRRFTATARLQIEFPYPPQEHFDEVRRRLGEALDHRSQSSQSLAEQPSGCMQ